MLTRLDAASETHLIYLRQKGGTTEEKLSRVRVSWKSQPWLLSRHKAKACCSLLVILLHVYDQEASKPPVHFQIPMFFSSSIRVIIFYSVELASDNGPRKLLTYWSMMGRVQPFSTSKKCSLWYWRYSYSSYRSPSHAARICSCNQQNVCRGYFEEVCTPQPTC